MIQGPEGSRRGHRPLVWSPSRQKMNWMLSIYCVNLKNPPPTAPGRENEQGRWLSARLGPDGPPSAPTLARRHELPPQIQPVPPTFTPPWNLRVLKELGVTAIWRTTCGRPANQTAVTAHRARCVRGDYTCFGQGGVRVDGMGCWGQGETLALP